jgi:acyl-coenzyme A synthetase/AMP-(fatty) acid ligase
MAFVVLHPQHAAKWAGRHHEFSNDLKNHAKVRLPGFACPEWIEVVPDLPVSHRQEVVLRMIENALFCFSRKHLPVRFSRVSFER